MDTAIETTNRTTESMENIQLYMMQISELMGNLNTHIRTVSLLLNDFDNRLITIENSMNGTRVNH